MTFSKPFVWSGVQVLILGDIMLDRFVYGEVERISPEGPVPVLRITGSRAMPGGAANVAANVLSLGGSPTLIGAVGRDAAGDELAGLLTTAAVRHELVRSARCTTLKTRFIARNQQVMRADDEDLTPADDLAEQVLATFKSALPTTDVVVISDYAKGLLTEQLLAHVIEAARVAGKITVVDPKKRDFQTYRGATILTPNRAEAAAATGIEPITHQTAVAAGEAARKKARATAVLVTRGADGMSLVSALGARHFKSSARQVFDVSGAGDTVVATLALALGAGSDFSAAAEIANVAAGLVVAKLGTATVTREELATAMSEPSYAGRVTVSLEEAVDLAAGWRVLGEKVGFTNGCFDMLHPGHVQLLRHARSHCDRLIVGLNSDASVSKLKGPMRPVLDAASRAAMLAALRFVDAVVVFEEQTPRRLIEALRPDVLIKGADYRREEVVGGDLVVAHGGRVVLADLLPGHSTSKTLETLRNGG